MPSENIPIRRENVIRLEYQDWGHDKEWNMVYVCRGCGLRWTVDYQREAYAHHCPVKDAVYGHKD